MKMENQISKTPSLPQPSMPDRLPNPSPRTAGSGKLVLAAIAALLLVGGAVFWLTRDGETRAALREQAAAALDGATQGTPLAFLGDALRGARPVPPVGESSRSGTGTGRMVQGTVAAPLDRSLPPEGASARESSSAFVVASPSVPASPPPQATAPRVTADTTVRPDFIEDLAAYIVSRYRPGQNQGSLSLSVQGINQRYGTKMTGLAGSGQGNRAGILRYVFSPAMIQGLYGLYVDRFLEALRQRSAEKSFTPEQTRQLFMALAGRSVMLAGGLEGVAALPDLGGRMKKLEQVSQNVVSVNAEIMQVVFELDQLREDKASQARIDEIQSRLNGLSARYRKALDERETAQRALTADIRKGGGQSLDDDTLLFLTHWVERRLHDTPQSLASTRSAAGVLRDLARRCAQPVAYPASANALPTAPSGGLP
jgi:outer membrane murein-binding lipoprotein Lpp